MESQERIRLIIAEDQDLVRRGISISLSFAADMACLGEARNGDEAVKLAAAIHPDVVLMDLHMPVKGGVAATREIRIQDPRIQVLVLTTLSDDDTIFEAILAGAQGYLLKDVDDGQLLESIRALKRHEPTLTAPIARKILDKFRGDTRLAKHGASTSLGFVAERSAPRILALSAEEAGVLSLLAEGLSPPLAATTLGCSERELKSHLSRIMDKLHINSAAEHASRAAGEPVGRSGAAPRDNRDGKR